MESITVAITEALHNGETLTKLKIIVTAKTISHGKYGLKEIKEEVDLLIKSGFLVIARQELKRSREGDYEITYYKATHST